MDRMGNVRYAPHRQVTQDALPSNHVHGAAALAESQRTQSWRTVGLWLFYGARQVRYASDQNFYRDLIGYKRLVPRSSLDRT